MDPRGRRVAMMLAGVVGLAAAVVLLRQTEDGASPDRDDVVPTVAAAPTTVQQRAEPGVVLPADEREQQPPGGLRVTGGDRLLRVAWDPEPEITTGYDVRWGRSGEGLTERMLVAASEVELRGLDNGARYDVEVRGVDAYGRRSEPVAADGAPKPPATDAALDGLTGLFDDFHGDDAPDPELWAVQRAGRSCLRAGAGSGAEDDRLVLELRCGSSEAVLRSRVPLRLTEPTGADGEYGRIVVVTDGPVPGGELSIAVVPGPVHALGVAAGSAAFVPGPGVAQGDGRLAPGAIRAVVTGDDASITAALDVPPTTTPPLPDAGVELGAPGVTVTWELRLTTAGALLYRDGTLVASGGVVPAWREARVLVGFSASPGDAARLHVDGIGFTGEASEPPRVVDVPNAVAGDAAQSVESRGPGRRPLEAAPGAVAAQVQLLVGPTSECRDGDLSADFDGVSVPFRPAVPGGMPATGPFCPVVADLTPDLLARLTTGQLTTPIVRSAAALAQSFGNGVLEVTYSPTATYRTRPAADSPGPPPDSSRDSIARLAVELRDAAGEPLVEGEPLSRGRVVLDVVLDGLAGQRDTGRCGGVAGIEVRLDGRLVAGLPTRSDDGGAAAGSYQFGLAGSLLEPGSHTIEVLVLGSEEGARSRSRALTFLVDG